MNLRYAKSPSICISDQDQVEDSYVKTNGFELVAGCWWRTEHWVRPCVPMEVVSTVVTLPEAGRAGAGE
ncbi:hypothetical protein FRAHR75_2120004 [Frankia sp. Hr75.2]|nr:hypothetical protein FRAHR75_2120004 [Frankia sp. Hr75.2]